MLSILDALFSVFLFVIGFGIGFGIWSALPQIQVEPIMWVLSISLWLIFWTIGQLFLTKL